MTGPDQPEHDGYAGSACLIVGGSSLGIQVELSGYFQPIDGRYHWYGRIAPNDEISALLAGGQRATLRTPHGASQCLVGDPDLWNRYRVSGHSAPPFPTALTSRPPRH